MKILAFTDVHGVVSFIRIVREKAKKHRPDVIIFAGDLTIFQQHLEKLMGMLDSFGFPLLLIHGNHETEGGMRKAVRGKKNLTFLHKRHLAIKDCVFAGYGGGGFAVIDADFERHTKNILRHKAEHPEKKLILVTHGPPYNTRLDRIGKNPCGNKSVRAFIERHKPDLVIAGHIHENFRKRDRIGKTRLVNPGPQGNIIQI
ncbi:TPA: hypothetical protein HA361_03805 [Candidatus Woesearchaeota archaeon]|nr:hypothetical protein [Candidatus Woesearchaeota archaeon]HII68825.1 hypothetical protein [Candidatus Woesearchaeota archaeon]